jgi:phosphate transport system substrate-binding protein
VKNSVFTSLCFLCLVLVLSGCSVDNDVSQFKLNPNQSNIDLGLRGQMAGSGATSQKNSIDAWKLGYNAYYPNISVAYDPKGSGGGRKDIISGASIFAASDKLLSDEEIKLSKSVCGSNGVIQIPTYISKIEIIFNLDNIKSLSLDNKTITAIFSGKITNWSDSLIKLQNPQINLPNKLITVVRRSDDSGTNDTLTSFFSKTDESLWQWGETSSWPSSIASLSQGAQGTAGVVIVSSLGDGTISYADSAQVGTLGVVAMDNPIMQISYMLACSHYNDIIAGQFVKSWLGYIISKSGQELSHNVSNSMVLNDSQTNQAKKDIDSITIGKENV